MSDRGRLARLDGTIIYLACAFVAARVVHSVIHLTTNNVLHRLFAFAAGIMILIAIWVWRVLWVAQTV